MTYVRYDASAAENHNGASNGASNGSHAGTADSSPEASDGPTAREPLRGLKHLPKVAVLGREAILALAAQPAVYAWQDIVVVGTIVVIAGGPGEGKTTLLFLILAARATFGGPVNLLARYVAPAPRGKWIVLIEGEHNDASTSRKLVKSMRLLDIGEEALDRFIIVARKQVLIGSPEWLEVEHLIACGLITDIAIDTIARVAPSDANDEREQVALFDRVAAAIDRAPVGSDKPVAWAVGHTKKSGTGDLSDVSGSTQRTGQADSVLLVKGTRIDGRVVSSRVTFAKLREDPDDFPLAVDFAIERNDDGQTQLRMGGEVQDKRPLHLRMVELLRAKGPLTKGQLKTQLGRNGGDVEAAITELFRQGRLRTTTKTVRGQERAAFELKSHDVATEEEP